MTRTAVFLLLAAGGAAAHAAEMRIVTAKGFVAFAVPDDWAAIQAQTKPPISVFAFQIPNPADEGTDDSTNLSISLYQRGSRDAEAALKRAGRSLGDAPPTIGAFKTWTTSRQEPRQGATSYSVIDAKKRVADVVVVVRLAWPHLPRNPPGYDERMEAALHAVLESIHGRLGAYKPKDGEVVRRPAN